MAAWGEVVKAENPYESGLSGQGMVSYRVSGNGTEAATILAGVEGKQIHIVGGAVAAEDEVKVAIIDGSTTILTIPFGLAGIVAIPPVWISAGSDLKMQLSGAVTTSAWVDVVQIVDGQQSSLVS